MTQTITQSQQLNILYLDDQRRDIANFTQNTLRYNRDNDNGDDLPSVVLQTTIDVDQAIRILERDKTINAFVCDHNMPNKKGLELITQWLKRDFSHLLFVLYTGGGNIDETIKSTCKENSIMLFNKAEEFSLLMEKMFSRLSIAPPNYLRQVYEKITEDIISDMKRTEILDPSFRIMIEENEYEPGMIVDAINKRTKFGVDYVMKYIDGLKFFKKN